MTRSERRPLRILVAHHVSRSRNGGMSRLMGFTHDELVAQNGHVVDYFCKEDVPSALGGRLARITFPILVFRHALSQARFGKPYDIINIHEPSAAAVIAGRSALGRPPIVVMSYGIERRGWKVTLDEARSGRASVPLKTRVLYPSTSLWQSAFSLRRADHIFCSNTDDRSYLINELRRPVTSVTRIFSGSDRLYASAAVARSYDRAQHLLFAGTWIERKGIRDFLAAFAQIAQRHLGVDLIVLGAGAPDPTVVESFPPTLRSRVRCVQVDSDQEAARIFATGDIFILPSLFEGTPLTLVEAMMSGLPVVTTATCGMKDVICNGENGLLVPIRSPQAIAEAVERLLQNADLRNKLGRAAQRDALERYTWDRVSMPICETYERLCVNRLVSPGSGSVGYVLES